MLTETITLDSSGTILLPLPMRQALGISIGSELIIGLTDQGLVIKPKLSQPSSPRARARQILAQAGLLTELGPRLKELAASSTVTLAEVISALDQLSNQSLSDLVLAQRQAKLW